MNNKLSKIGLLLISVISCLYGIFLIGGLEPNPITNEKVTEGSQSAIVLTILFSLLCVSGIFVKEKHINKYRICSNILAVLRFALGEFGAFWFTFYVVWQEEGIANPLTIFTDLNSPDLFLGLGVILLLLSLPIIWHIGALMCFEYGLKKEFRMKKLNAYKILLICTSIIAIIGFSTMGTVLFSQMQH